ncbi:MAG: hypothetical protein ABR976_08430 [Terracidiphilus sp.]|jgi:hypothetical protein
MISFNHRILEELRRVIFRLGMMQTALNIGSLWLFAETGKRLAFHDANNLFLRDPHPNRPEGVAP